MKTLRSKFLVYVAVPVLFIIGLTGAASYLTARSILMEQLRERGVGALQQYADEFDATFGASVQTLGILSVHAGLTCSDRNALAEIFKDLRKRLPVETIFLVGMDGRVISAEGDQSFGGPSPLVLAPWFADALTEGEPVVSAPHRSELSGKTIITVANKVRDDQDRITGVLAYDILVENLQAGMRRYDIYKELYQPIFFIMGRDGTYLLHTDKNLIGDRLGESKSDLHVRMREALSEERREWVDVGLVDGERYFGGFQRSKYADVFISLEIPLSTGLYPVTVLAGIYAVLGLVCLTMLSFVMIVLSRRIARPLRMLTVAAVAASKGDYNEVQAPVSPDDELGALVTAFNKMATGMRQRDRIRNTFGRYVTPEIVDELLESENGLRLGGDKRKVSLLMSDLRGFSAHTANMAPDKVILMLNRYFAAMVEILLRRKAIIDELQGDGILAFFGAPVQLPEHAAYAVAAALEMQAAMDDINRLNEKDNFPKLEMGIGINTGEVILGNIGSEQRAKYGAVGAAVNFAGRIESYTLGGQILISESTYSAVREIAEIRDVLDVEMKGFTGAVKLYDVRGLGDPFNLRIHERKDKPKGTAERIAVRLRRIDDKVVSPKAEPAWITHLSETRVIMETTERLPEGIDVRMEGADPTYPQVQGDAFGRITAVSQGDHFWTVSVRFTFLAPALRRALREFLSATPD